LHAAALPAGEGGNVGGGIRCRYGFLHPNLNSRGLREPLQDGLSEAIPTERVPNRINTY
jgi:hypothetical protein